MATLPQPQHFRARKCCGWGKVAIYPAFSRQPPTAADSCRQPSTAADKRKSLTIPSQKITNVISNTCKQPFSPKTTVHPQYSVGGGGTNQQHGPKRHQFFLYLLISRKMPGWPKKFVKLFENYPHPIPFQQQPQHRFRSTYLGECIKH